MKIAIGGATILAASVAFAVCMMCAPLFNRDRMDEEIWDNKY